MSIDDVSEKALLSGVMKLARLKGWLAYHTHDSRHSPSGFPDLVLVRDGQIVFVELKTRKGSLSPSQSQWIDALRKCAGAVQTYVWRPADWKDGAIDEVLAQ